MRAMIIVALAGVLPVSAQTPAWPVAAPPITVVGTATGDPNQELVGVLGAYRQSDGHLVVAASNPLQLRRYDVHGTFVSLVGHRGAGPGEYRGRLSLYAGHADSILIYDDATSRWTLYQPNGTVVRSWIATTAERQHFAPIAYRRTLIHPTRQSGPRLLSDVDRRAAGCRTTPPIARYSLMERTGPGFARRRRRSGRSARWPAGRWDAWHCPTALNSCRSVRALSWDDGVTAMGWNGSRSFESRCQRIRRHRPAPAGAIRFHPTVPRRPDVSTSISATSRARATAFRIDYGHYAMTLDSVNRASNFTVSKGTEVHLRSARDGLGWDAVARSDRSPAWCRILIGDVAPIWMYRFAFCGP